MPAGYQSAKVEGHAGASVPSNSQISDHRVISVRLKGLWFRARYNYIDIDGDGGTVRDVRIIVNYNLPFL